MDNNIKDFLFRLWDSSINLCTRIKESISIKLEEYRLFRNIRTTHNALDYYVNKIEFDYKCYKSISGRDLLEEKQLLEDLNKLKRYTHIALMKMDMEDFYSITFYESYKKLVFKAQRLYREIVVEVK